MIVLLLLLVVAATAWTALEVRADRPRTAPRSHRTDPDAVPPAERLSRR